MVNSNADAIGIIFPNSYDSTMPELTRERSLASVPFAARYRLIDFILSNMVNGAFMTDLSAFRIYGEITL